MEQVFGEKDQVTTGVATDDAAKAAKKEKVAEMKSLLQETVQSDPTFNQKLRKLSSALKVVNTLGYGKEGNIVVDKQATTANNGQRVIKATSPIVGYIVANEGGEPIQYRTEIYSADAEGKFVGQSVTKTLEPGQTAVLTRRYMTELCSRPEISFTLANGKIVASGNKKAKTFEEELGSYYFIFDKAEGKEVNDDEIKLSIDDGGKIKPEYVEAFGYLNNPKPTKTREKKASSSYSTQDVLANYVQKMLKSNSNL